MFGDGSDPDAPLAEHGLKGHGVLPLPGESRKLPDKYLPEGGIRLGGLVQHPAELGSVGYPTALGLIHVLAGNGVAVALGVVAERPQLGGHGEVHVLAVARDPGVEGRRSERMLLVRVFLLALLLVCGSETQSIWKTAVTITPWRRR